MKVQLLEYTPNPDSVVAAAARQCYSGGFVGDTYHPYFLDIDATSKDYNEIDRKMIEKIMCLGHLSVLEHAAFTFAIEGISRTCSHQLVRFRVASFSQQSQRYCFLGKEFKKVVPPLIASSIWSDRFDDLMAEIGQFYADMVDDGIPAEDARFVLPNACETNIVMTMNARELHHMFDLRCCTMAQWEIRDLANEILRILQDKEIYLFNNAGPTCVTKGICGEGPRCCGRVNKE